MDVISELVGVDRADRAEIRRLADVVVHREDGVFDVPPAGMEAAMTLVAYYQQMVDDRRRSRREDLTSALLDAEIDGDKLTDDEIIAFLFLMVVAGNETTTKLLGNAWYWGWRHPDQGAKPFTDPGRVVPWIEETLRYDTSSQMLLRVTRMPMVLHGVEIPEGSRVLLLVGSANRTNRSSPTPTATTWTGTPVGWSASAAAGTSAWGPPWPGWRPGSGWPLWSSGWPPTRWIRPASSASTPSTCAAWPPCPPR